MLGFGGAAVIERRITVGAFVAFGLYLANLTWPLIALVGGAMVVYGIAIAAAIRWTRWEKPAGLPLPGLMPPRCASNSPTAGLRG